MSARGAPGWLPTRAAGVPVEVRRDGRLSWVQWSRVPVPQVSPPVGVVARVVDADDQVGEVDPLVARLVELISAARAEGRPVGRRTVARELGVSEYRGAQLLARTNNNGTGGTP